jgi:hypothetical protein
MSALLEPTPWLGKRKGFSVVPSKKESGGPVSLRSPFLSLDARGIGEQGYRNRSQSKDSESGVITTIRGDGGQDRQEHDGQWEDDSRI